MNNNDTKSQEIARIVAKVMGDVDEAAPDARGELLALLRDAMGEAIAAIPPDAVKAIGERYSDRFGHVMLALSPRAQRRVLRAIAEGAVGVGYRVDVDAFTSELEAGLAPVLERLQAVKVWEPQ